MTTNEIGFSLHGSEEATLDPFEATEPGIAREVWKCTCGSFHGLARAANCPIHGVARPRKREG